MLKIYYIYGEEYKVNFNSSKSYAIVCTKKNYTKIETNFKLHGSIINIVPSVAHLGYTIGKGHGYDVKCGLNDLMIRTQYLLARFGSCTSDVKTSCLEVIAPVCMDPHFGLL